jgi:ankyrin repeat protein
MKKWNYQDLTNDGKAVCKAILDNNSEELESFILKHGVEAPVGDGTALHFALLNDQTEMARLLLTHKADPDKIYNHQWTPLTLAIDYEDLLTTKMLLDFGADVNKKDGLNNSPLSRAIYQYQEDTTFLELLLKKGADPYQELINGYSPMQLAISRGLESLLKKLILKHSPSSIKK